MPIESSQSHGTHGNVTRLLSHAVNTILAGSLLAFPAAQAHADDSSNREIFSYAVELYKAGKFSAAYGRFKSLADSGNREAAKNAIFMLRNGALLYGTEWSATPSEITRWLALTSDHSGLQGAGARE